ncbi:MAG: holo-ACP synthase [Candidatus Thorarchaeota archaeon]
MQDAITVGTDVVEVSRFRRLPSGPQFFRRVFTDRELSYCLSHPDPAPHMAATFAGKEAVWKAIRGAVPIREIEILHDEKGAPYVQLARDTGLVVSVSLAHSSRDAVAVAIASDRSLKDASVRPSLESASHSILRGEMIDH